MNTPRFIAPEEPSTALEPMAARNEFPQATLLGPVEKDAMWSEENSELRYARAGRGADSDRPDALHGTAADAVSGLENRGRELSPPAGLTTDRILSGASSTTNSASPADGVSRISPDETRPAVGLRGTDDGWREAAEKEAVCVEFKRLTGEGMGLNAAARAMGKAPSWFSGAEAPYQRWLREGLAGLLPKGGQGAKDGELTKWILDLGWFIPAARFFYLLTNNTWKSGSVPEAIRRTVSLPALPPEWSKSKRASFLKAIENGCLLTSAATAPECPVELREMVLAREKAGKELVPEKVARMVAASPAKVRQSRNPKNTDLDLFCSPGYLRLRRPARSAGPTNCPTEYEALRAGQSVQPDDGSVNFCVCVPWPYPTTACSRKFGVLVDRFQLLLAVDTMSLNIGARSYIVRPRSSYRQEDVLKLYHVYMLQHGIPDEVQHEGGVWAGKRVLDCLDLLKVRRHRLHSPHPKVAVEGRFNKLWTVMSVLTGGQVGRFRGEMERENALLTACKAGQEDPRKWFPMLGTALGAIDQAISETNGTTVNTEVGRWVPSELFAEGMAASSRRQLQTEMEWMFRPFVREWKLRQALCGGDIPLFEDFSVPFHFAAPWMTDWIGARVRVYFDPYAETLCWGKFVLSEDFRGHKAGEIIGDARQVHGIAEFARLSLGYGDGPSDYGREMRQRMAAGLRRDTRAIMPTAREGHRVVEERDGISGAARLEINARSEQQSNKETEKSQLQTSNRTSNVQLPTLNVELEKREAELESTPLDFL
jgi:hypothetical protein